jgi:rRNA maturation RNase YbeY
MAEVVLSGRLPRALGLSRGEVAAAAEFFAGRSSRRSGKAFREISVVVQDDAGSDAAHRAVMDVPGATDVITQNFDAMPGEPDGVYGELYVNAERAIVAAPKRGGWSPAREFLLYLAHGMDHLSGADDLTRSERARMRRRELRWLAEFGRRAACAAPAAGE